MVDLVPVLLCVQISISLQMLHGCFALWTTLSWFYLHT